MPSMLAEILGRLVEVECSEEDARENLPFREAWDALKRSGGYVTSPKGTPLWLLPCRGLWQDAAEYFDEGDVEAFLFCASNDWGVRLVSMNMRALKERGILESAFLQAFIGVRVNHKSCRFELAYIFSMIDRARMRLAGDPLPGPGPFTMFRGVAGHGTARVVCGYSWSGDFERAMWFAVRFADGLGLADPAVFRATVAEEDVYVYSNDRNEQEFIVDRACFERPGCRPVRVWRQRDEAGAQGQT